MKRKIFFIALMLLILITSKTNAQFGVPDAFNYQAILRNNMGNPMPNQSISIKFSITDSTGTIVAYSEKFDTTTNQFGLINLEIGKGTVLSGTFSDIDWYYSAYYGRKPFLKVAIDTSGSGTYTFMGLSQLISVPYAECAKYAGPWYFNGPPPPQFLPPSVIWFIGNNYNTNVGIGTSTPVPEAILDLTRSHLKNTELTTGV